MQRILEIHLSRRLIKKYLVSIILKPVTILIQITKVKGVFKCFPSVLLNLIIFLGIDACFFLVFQVLYYFILLTLRWRKQFSLDPIFTTSTNLPDSHMNFKLLKYSVIFSSWWVFSQPLRKLNALTNITSHFVGGEHCGEVTLGTKHMLTVSFKGGKSSHLLRGDLIAHLIAQFHIVLSGPSKNIKSHDILAKRWFENIVMTF